MFLIFRLGRFDVMPTGDLGVQEDGSAALAEWDNKASVDFAHLFLALGSDESRDAYDKMGL